MTTTEDALFRETVAGRFPLSNNFGAARNWIPTGDGETGQYIPRPDASLATTRLLATFGLDHFYLRSPATGIWKLITVIAAIGVLSSSAIGAARYLIGGGLALWWIWDLLQLFGEGGRVMNYGMMPPFDLPLFDPVGQGMISDGEIQYKKSYSSVWLLTELLSILGLNQIARGKVALGGFYVLAFLVPSLFIAARFTKWPDMSDLSRFFLLLFASVYAYFGVAHTSTWFVNLGRLLTETNKIMEKSEDGGLKVSMPDVLNPYFYREGEERNANIFFTPFTAAEIQERFKIQHVSEKDLPSANSAGQDVLDIALHTVLYPFLYVFQTFAGVKQKCPEVPETAEVGTQTGGARKATATESLSAESQVLGAAVLALIAGGGIKGLVDYFLREEET